MKKILIAAMLLAGSVQAQEVASAPGGVLRALDKTSGNTLDIDIRTGQFVNLGNLQIVMIDCRYPVNDPAGNAYAALEVSETGTPGTIFSGWMIASAPALNGLEHQRYDLWVMRCSTS